MKYLMSTTSLLWTLSNCLISINGAKILGIFPVAAKSHFAYQEAIMKSLHTAGHNITIICPSGMTRSQKNYTVLSSSFVSFDSTITGSIYDFVTLPLRTYSQTAVAISEKYCEDFLKVEEIQKILNGFVTANYDVVFHEYLPFHDCYSQLSKKLNAPLILTMPIRAAPYVDWNIGNPSSPAIVPNGFTYSSKKMNFYQRLENALYHIYTKLLFYNYIIPRERQVKEKFRIPDTSEDYSLIFQNSHPSLLPRELLPSVIEIGGIHLKAAKPLPQNIQKFIDESEFGVILFTFGSMAQGSFMNPQMVNAFRNAFAEIPQRVIWKFEKNIEGLSNNVLLSNWIPQRDILAHKNVKAFITHCGQGGVYEAIHEGVPLIMTPFYGDQLYNAATLEELGIGIYLNVLTVTKEKILNSINAVVNDTRYGQKMEEISKIFNDNPMSPQEAVVYWTEYVIRHHGAPHLKTAGQGMPFYQYFLLDVIGFVFVTAVACFYMVYLFCKIVQKCRKSHDDSKKKKKS